MRCYGNMIFLKHWIEWRKTTANLGFLPSVCWSNLCASIAQHYNCHRSWLVFVTGCFTDKLLVLCLGLFLPFSSNIQTCMWRSSHNDMLHIPLTVPQASCTSFLEPYVVILDKWQGKELPEGQNQLWSLILAPDEVVECLEDINHRCLK